MRFPGDEIGGWVLEERIGQGAMGEVWSASRAANRSQKAAVKMLKTNSFDAPRERFTREIEALTRLEHPNIVRILEWGEAPVNESADTVLFFAMELLDGITLSERLKRGPMVPGEVITAMIPIAEALAYIHEAGLAHRDVKPGNIMLCEDGIARLVDFGIAQADENSRLTAMGRITGSGPYLPPETFDGGEMDFKLADVYGLGVVIYEALVHHTAFMVNRNLSTAAQQFKLVQAKKTSALDPGDRFYDDVREMVMSATQPDPSKRMQSATELAEAMIALDVEPFDPNAPTDTQELLPRRRTPPPQIPGSNGAESKPERGLDRVPTAPPTERTSAPPAAGPSALMAVGFALAGVVVGLVILAGIAALL